MWQWKHGSHSVIANATKNDQTWFVRHHGSVNVGSGDRHEKGYDMKLAAFVLILVCCIWTLPEAGKIYEWTDENGVKHFSEEPPPKGENIVKKIETIPSDNASDQKPLQEETGAVKKDMQQQEASTSQAAQAGSSGLMIQTTAILPIMTRKPTWAIRTKRRIWMTLTRKKA